MRTASDEMSPKGVKFRESRDSDAHPNTFGVCVFLDVTGSMHHIPEKLVREKLGHLMSSMIKHGLPDAQVLFGAIGDQYSDQYPLQVGQFESGTEELNKWLTNVYLEGNGGGQHMESYPLAWFFAARHTSCDGFEKRGHKGLLFTIGDEAPWNKLGSDEIKNIFGEVDEEVSAEQLLAEVQRSYHVFHIHTNEASYRNSPEVLEPWKKLLNERLLICNDYTQIAELIASTVAVIHGIDLDKFTSDFDSKTASDVKNALAKVSNSLAKPTSGVMTL